jgi:D-sedoheptulose 7-phosphate isomerase
MALPDPRVKIVRAHLRRSAEIVESVAADTAFTAAIVAIAERIAASLKRGGKVLLAGNGGSAADAQHIAAEFVGRFVNDRAPLAAIALTTDTSALTSIGNDYGFEKVFERQVRALGHKGDVFLAISTSGRSPNIIEALKAARKAGLATIGFTKAAKTPMHRLCDLTLAVPSEETALIQQIHITAAHAICHLVERELFGAKQA